MVFAVCAPGLEAVLLGEVQALGFSATAVPGGVEVPSGDIATLNRWLRTASRVLVRLGEPFRATAFPELVRKASALPWEKFIRPGAPATFRVTCRKSRLYHSRAVAERLQTALDARLGTLNGDTRLGHSLGTLDRDTQLFIARIERDMCTVSADSSGPLLHQRGYRGPQAKAPLRETLAAALLLSAEWDPATRLCDPLCGSGTIAIEAALLAAGRAPGAKRSFSFEKWSAWDVRPFQDRAAPNAGRIEGSDQDAGAVAAARENADRAGVAIELVQRTLAAVPPDGGPGMIACNPPYGVRIAADVRRVFRDLGDVARRRPGWKVAAIVADSSAMSAAGLRWNRLLRTENGGIPVDFVVSDPVGKN
ncbi:MAG: class I SAM-dependent RNA methyltransferase [Myxococcales bacterium]